MKRQSKQEAIKWKIDLLTALPLRTLADEKVIDMMAAGLRRAHSEGIQDAAYICSKVSTESGNQAARRIAGHMYTALVALDQMNQEDFDIAERTEMAARARERRHA
jgi:BMFP domain-containing protein YqiC